MESVLLVTLLITIAMAAPMFKRNTLDMSHNFNKDTIYWPTNTFDQFTLNITIKEIPGSYMGYAEGFYMAGEHGGTHIDSPYHFNLAGDAWRVEQIPVDRMVAPAVVVDVRDKVQNDTDYQATLDDYMLWEAEFGEMPDKAVFLLCTGWEERWPKKKLIFGTDNIYNQDEMHFPGMHPDLVEWLMDNRNMVGVGIDTPTPDGARTLSSLEVHIMTAAKNIYILENVKGACDIPRHGTTLIIFPMKIEGGTGAPTRIVGTWGEDAETSCSSGVAKRESPSLAVLPIVYFLLSKTT